MSNESPILTQSPLSPQQQGMFFESEMSENSSLHLEQSVWRIEGKMDKNRFKECWQKIHDHHHILRTCFSWNEHTPPIQIVLKPFKIRFSEVSCSNVPAEISSTIEQILSDGSAKGFKLNQPPLSRFSLVIVSDTLHYLIWEHHHILLDGWSVQLIAKDLIALYQGESISASKQYEEYVKWLGDQNSEQSEEYWNSLLNKHDYATTPGQAGHTNAHRQNAHFTKSGETTHGTTPSQEPVENLIRLKWELDQDTTGKLRSLAKENRVTLNHLLKTIWALLLSKWNRSESICYGVTVSGRPYQMDGADKMAGLFINTVPEALLIEPDASFISIAQQIKELEFERENHEYHTTGVIHQWSGYPGAKSLFESLLVFDEYNHQEPQYERNLQISFEDQWYRGGTTSEPVTLLINAGEKVRFECIGLTQYLRNEALQTIKSQFLQMLMSILNNGPDQSAKVLKHTPSGTDPLFHLKPNQPEIPQPMRESTAVDPKMVEIWMEVLGIDGIQSDDNFFELGGHSLLAIKIANRIRDSYSVEIPLKNLFQNPTLNGMSEQVSTIRNSMNQIQLQTESVTGDSEEGEL